jgi:hypothetical protein
MKIANSKCRPLVEAREPFQGSNLWGGWHDSTLVESNDRQYVVYSWGHHFPIYIYDEVTQQWFGNADRFSQSTTRHQWLARPLDVEIHWLHTHPMSVLAVCGYTELVKRRLLGRIAA